MHSTNILDGFGRCVEINFDRKLSNYGGLATALFYLRRNGFFKILEKALRPYLPNQRQASKVKFSSWSLFEQRLIGLIAGKEDLNDYDLLKNDPGFITALGRHQLASTATLCRFERSIDQSLIDAANRFLLDVYFRYGYKRKYIFIDVDNTPVELFGHQENVKFNGHYRCNCYLPLLSFIDGFPIGVFNGTQDGRKTMIHVFESMIQRIKQHNPNTIITLRADTGFNSKELIDLCDKLGCYYLIGLSPNKALIHRLSQWEPEFVDVLRRAPEVGGSLLRHYGEIEDYQAKSWSGSRRVIARDYFDDQRRQWDCRFIQTNIPRSRNQKCGNLWRKTSRELYEELYCERCLAEKHNQEFKAQAFGARASSSRFLTNSYRMILGAICQLAYRLLRLQLFRKKTAWNASTLMAFRQTFICAPAVIEQMKTKVKITLNAEGVGVEAIERFWRVLQT